MAKNFDGSENLSNVPSDKKLEYTKPKLTTHGSVREMTKGASGPFVDGVGRSPFPT
jgi:hypothetical protein